VSSDYRQTGREDNPVNGLTSVVANLGSFLRCERNRDARHQVLLLAPWLDQGVRMKRAFLLFAVVLPLSAPPAFGRAPELNVAAICKARSTDAKILRSRPDQSMADCMHDEESAKQQLSSLWESTSAAIRNQCESDARSLGTMSYLDLLACLQTANDVTSGSNKQTGKQ
jgi:hypothetical protein